jgi:hypothetical protein
MASEYRKFKRPFPPAASTHPVPCPLAILPLVLGSARTPRAARSDRARQGVPAVPCATGSHLRRTDTREASRWPALDVAGRPQAHAAGHGPHGGLGTGSRRSWSGGG